MYRMTYNNKGVSGCSARGIAKRESIEELLELAEALKDTICNIEIKQVEDKEKETLPMELDKNMKEMK